MSNPGPLTPPQFDVVLSATSFEQYHPSPRRVALAPVDTTCASDNEPIINFMPQPPPLERYASEHHLRPRIIERRRPTTCEPKVETRRFRHFLRATGSTFAERDADVAAPRVADRLEDVNEAASIRQEIPAVTLFPPQGRERPWRRVISRTLQDSANVSAVPMIGGYSTSSATTPSSEASVTSLGALFSRGLQLRQLSEFPLKAEVSPKAMDAAPSPSIPHERAWRDDGSRLAPELLSTPPAATTTAEANHERTSFGNQRQRIQTTRHSNDQHTEGAGNMRRRHTSQKMTAAPAHRKNSRDSDDADDDGVADDDDDDGDDFELAVASVTSYTRRSSQRPASAL
ncbi:Hypothetical protein, putative [Bodo saltans]|uniref:Uncharacterized protein n=1 Tax=Bodo saltans TaxID=75058 RepID=A0A0S4KJ42_BODSA|nr:Hypothetical protein, putative [Bodo saltans]|eukprot:CUI14467.1 Hypothetical protein, putative [Bodo saltans]